MTPAHYATLFFGLLAVAALLYAMHVRGIADDLEARLRDANDLIDDLLEVDE